MAKATYREACCSCRKIKDVYVGSGMIECLCCKELVCIDCACSEGETTLFIETTSKGKIIKDDPDPDMNGPCGWVCPSCFKNQFGREPRRPGWSDSPSSGADQGFTEEPMTSKKS